MKRALHVTGVVVSIAAMLAVGLYVARMSGNMDLDRFIRGRAALGVILAALASAAVIPISAVAWNRLLASCGEHLAWSNLVSIMGVTQLAKYLPGNIGQHVGRLAFSSREGLAIGVVATTIAVESILAVLAAAVVGMAGCLAAGAPVLERWMGNVDHDWIATGALLAFAIVGAIWLAPSAVATIVHRTSSGRVLPRLPKSMALTQAFLLYICNYIVLGTGITAMAYLVADITWQNAALLTGAFAMAWILGFFVPGAPAGLGVREGVMLALLHAAGLKGDGVAVVIGMRVATTLGDVLCFVAAGVARFASKRRRHTATVIDKGTQKHGT